MRIVRVQTREEGNPFYPLPPDYFSGNYTENDRRVMRVNALRQWCLFNATAQDPPNIRKKLRLQKAQAYVACIDFLDRHYFYPEVQGDDVIFDPFFYTTPPANTPAYHWDVHRATILHKKTAAVGPRGSAKSVGICRKAIILRMLTRNNYPCTYATATDDLAEKFGDNTKYAIYENSRLNDDFGPELPNATAHAPGKFNPGRGHGQTGMGAFTLSNRSSLFCTSAQSRQRGGRPNLYVMDDPEWDPTSTKTEQQELLRVWFQQLVFQIISPMLQQADTTFLWTGTFISQQHYLWLAMQTKEVQMPDGSTKQVPADERFGSWYRIIQPAAIDDPTGAIDERTKKVRVVSCWPEMWPVDDEEKERLNLPDTTATLENIRKEVGESVWESEYMARPGKGEGSYFPQLTEIKHGYWFENADDKLVVSPTTSQTRLCWYRLDANTKVPLLQKMTLEEFCATNPRFIACDTSFTAGKVSDFKVAHCMAINSHNELFCFDIWGVQGDESLLVEESLRMATRWGASIHPEAVKQGLSLVNTLSHLVATNGVRHVTGQDYLPFVMGLRIHSGYTKCAKIGALLSRFVYGLVKMPLRADTEGSPWAPLFQQIRNFVNRGGDDTGLFKDDHLDTLAMHQWIVGGLPNPPAQQAPPPLTPLARMMNGEVYDDKGQPLLAKCLHEMTADQLHELIARADEAKEQKTSLHTNTGGF